VEETTWQKVAGSLPEGELRDHIMSHRFDELFELVDSVPGEKPEIRVDKRKIYEIEQAILAQIRPTKIKVLGVLVRGVDIGKIEFRPEAEQLLLNRWGAPWAQQIGLIEAETKGQGDLRTGMLKAQGELEAKMLEAQSDLEIARLKARAILINAEAEAKKLTMEGCSKAEAQAAFFRYILKSLQVDGRPSDPRLVRVVLGQLARSFASVNDLETFMRVHGEMNRQGFMIHQQVGRNGSSEVGE
jgi:regulator of protease activity HflC (stomatin/prohibitin superfamily)